jgi:hypothetical protein
MRVCISPVSMHNETWQNSRSKCLITDGNVTYLFTYIPSLLVNCSQRFLAHCRLQQSKELGGGFPQDTSYFGTREVEQII